MSRDFSHGPTPRWETLRSEDSEVHAFASELARLMYERGEDSIPSSLIEASDLEAASEAGAVKREDDEVLFTDTSVRCDYLVRHGASLLPESCAQDPIAFAEMYGEVGRKLIEAIGVGEATQRSARQALLLAAMEGQGEDLLFGVAELARSSGDGEPGRASFWDLYGPLCDIMPHLHPSADSVAVHAEAIERAAAGDLTNGRFYRAAEDMARSSKENAEALLEAALAQSNPTPLAASTLVGLSANHPKEAHRRALNLTDEEDPALRRAGVLALGMLKYEDRHGAQLRETWKRMQVLLEEDQDVDIHVVLARALGRLLEAAREVEHEDKETSDAQAPDPSEIGRRLAQMVSHGDARVRHEVTCALFLRAEKHVGAEWHEKAFFELADEPAAHGRTIRNLDHCANRYLEAGPPHSKKALAFLRTFALQRSEDEKTFELLSMTFSTLKNNCSEELRAELTRWFASEEPRLHREAARAHNDINGTFSDRAAAGGLRLSKAVLDELSEAEAVCAVQHACGYVAGGGESTAAVVLSPLYRDTCSDELSDFALDMLCDFVLYNFPGEGREALERYVGGDDAPEIVRQIAQEALERSERYYEPLRELPQLKELRPPTSRTYLLRRARQKRQSDAMERANAQSAFLSLVSRVPLKYGRASFHKQHTGEFSKPTELSTFSQTVEMPRGEYIDPVGSAYQRLRWRQATVAERDDPHGEDEMSTDQGDEK